jgi:hypothetical protein
MTTKNKEKNKCIAKTVEKLCNDHSTNVPSRGRFTHSDHKVVGKRQ